MWCGVVPTLCRTIERPKHPISGSAAVTVELTNKPERVHAEANLSRGAEWSAPEAGWVARRVCCLEDIVPLRHCQHVGQSFSFRRLLIVTLSHRCFGRLREAPLL